MAGVNKWIGIGNLGKDPEIRTLENGNKVANFSIATSETWKDKNGERQEKTEWHNISIWGKLADVVESYVTKGMTVYLEGKLQTRSWEDKDGNKRYTTEIVCNTMTMLGGKKENGNQQNISNPNPDNTEAGYEEHDLPF